MDKTVKGNEMKYFRMILITLPFFMMSVHASSINQKADHKNNHEHVKKGNIKKNGKDGRKGIKGVNHGNGENGGNGLNGGNGGKGGDGANG